MTLMFTYVHICVLWVKTHYHVFIVYIYPITTFFVYIMTSYAFDATRSSLYFVRNDDNVHDQSISENGFPSHKVNIVAIYYL